MANAFPYLSWNRDAIPGICPVPDFYPSGDYSLIFFFGLVRISTNIIVAGVKYRQTNGKLERFSMSL